MLQSIFREARPWSDGWFGIGCVGASKITLYVVVLLVGLTPRAGVGEDRMRQMQAAAFEKGVASWGYWGTEPEHYATWSTHSNRLLPVYTFGIGLDRVSGENSTYREAERLEQLYGREPAHTVNPTAEYFDQTDIYRLQKRALEAGKKYLVLLVFDGMDWNTTRAAAAYTSGKAAYERGRGTGLFFQDYRGAPTEFGYMVSSPYSGGARFDVDAQVVIEATESIPGGYDPELGGQTPWQWPVDLHYLISNNRERLHAFTDSAASATSMFSAIKTYNGAINVNRNGRRFVPFSRTLQGLGLSVGVVTSVPVSHATPAAAYANNVTRNDYQDLTRDLAGVPSISHRERPLRGLDVLVGAGWGVEEETDAAQGRNFVPGNKYVDDETLSKIDVANGGKYRVVKRTAGNSGNKLLAEAAREAAAEGQRLFGLFGTKEANLPFRTADGRYDPYVAPEEVRESFNPAQKVYNAGKAYSPADLKENPTLADMTRAALQVLSTNEKGFWLMVEAGDVDWAMHGNNLDNAIGAIRSGDEAFRAITEWVEANDAWQETAVIVTADHGHLFVLTDAEAIAAAGNEEGGDEKDGS